MPRIKSPISQRERDYNLRYTVGVQIRMLHMLGVAFDKRRWMPDDYDYKFFCDTKKRIKNQEELTDGQADHLTELYEKYTD
ncbi:MAG: hypothetical protein ACREJN_12335 [Nitrospiraceae bacterium]